jgi:signal peptidase II
VLPRRTIKSPEPSQVLSLQERIRWDLIVVAIGLAVLAVDQLTKALVLARFSGAHRYDVAHVLGDVLTLIFVQNTGTAFSLLQQSHAVYVIIPAAIGVVVWLYISQRPRNNPFLKVTFGLILGGALGNLLDRVRLGYVVDFIHFQIPGHFDWYVFNVADSCIVVGMLSLAATFFLLPRESEPGPVLSRQPGAGPSETSPASPGKTPADPDEIPDAPAGSASSPTTRVPSAAARSAISIRAPVAVGSAKAASKARRQRH